MTAITLSTNYMKVIEHLFHVASGTNQNHAFIANKHYSNKIRKLM